MSWENKSRLVVSCCVALALSACAASPKRIQASYVSPSQYKNYNCEELEQELQTLSAKVHEVTGQQKKAATNDAVITGVGVLLFWPSLFLLAATEDHKAELSRLKGEHEALMSAGKEKKCQFVKEMQSNAVSSEAKQ